MIGKYHSSFYNSLTTMQPAKIKTEFSVLDENRVLYSYFCYTLVALY